ncbi:MAG TPA: hypothetical protein VJ001_07865 [Rhodocyclaceae bacterium]|nr:hypothetical protein [Rhodocyclaceae bacterium]
MLGFFSGKPDHPLIDSRQAKVIFNEIAVGEPLRAVKEATVWLESLMALDGVKLEQRLNLVMQLDETAISQARRLGREYLAVGRNQRQQEAKLWEACASYWGHLAMAYSSCLERYHAQEKDADAVRRQLPMLYARLIGVLAAQLKWEQFRYGPISGEIWMALGRIYLAAVAAQCERKPRAVYPNASPTSIESEYLKALVFHASSMGNLTPMEIEIAERFIAHFLPFFSLLSESRPESVYWVDAAKSFPPTRLIKAPEASSTLRFFNGASGSEAVIRMMEQIRAEKHVPAEINLGAQYAVGIVLPVLNHLEKNWAPTPPVRSNVRHRVSSRLTVVHGLDAVQMRLAGDFDYFGQTDQAETWLVEDASLGGMGAQAPISHNDWIRIGALVAMQPEGGDNWLIGIVRRYARSGAHQGAVGIQTMSKSPQAIVADANGFKTEVILLDAPGVGGYVRIALSPAVLEERAELHFLLDGKTVELSPRNCLEKGDDYAIAHFFVQRFG